jgi:hypothetical protein
MIESWNTELICWIAVLVFATWFGRHDEHGI